MSFDDARILTGAMGGGDAAELRLAMSRIAGFIDNPIADVKITPETDTASPRTVTVQVRDRLNEPWKGRWWVRIAFGTSPWTANAGLTLVFTTVAIEKLLGDDVYDLLTDADGKIVFTMDGSADPYNLTACVLGRAQSANVVLEAAARTSGALGVDPEILAVL